MPKERRGRVEVRVSTPVLMGTMDVLVKYGDPNDMLPLVMDLIEAREELEKIKQRLNSPDKA